MKVSLNWLREYVDYDATPDALAELLTMAGVEVESVETRGLNLDKVVVAQILSREQHPNADRLGVCRVDDGSGEPPRQIVCGATNYQVGDKVPLALPGSVLPGDVKIKVGKLRGVQSEGMLCSAKELRLSDDAEGLLILSPDAPLGASIGSLYPSDTVFDLEITPNRPDLLSHLGLAREIAALSGRTLKDPVDLIEAPAGGEPHAHLNLMIAANARAACPIYTARLIDGVKVGPSPDWLRARLETVGVRSINNVVDITNFVMLELGQPLHAFDAAHIGLTGLGVRLASAGEELLALDGRTYKLRPHDLVIARGDGNVAEGLAGVMGGEESGVTAKTTRIILESAYFAPGGIRRTSRELGLSSDASYRFERGVDPAEVVAASRRAADLILEICGGQSLGISEKHDLESLPEDDYIVPLRLARVQQVLGTEISAARVEEILTGFGLTKQTDLLMALTKGDDWTSAEWSIPSHRSDLRREIDLVEEVTRVYGLDRVAGRAQASFAPTSAVDLTYDFAMSLRRRLVGLGFTEARSVSLVRHEAQAGGVPLKNPLTEDGADLRGTLLPGLLATAGRNVRLGNADLRLFEVGRIFAPEAQLGQPEPFMLGLVMTGSAQPGSWRHGSGQRGTDLHDLRGVIERIAAPGVVELKVIPPGADRPNGGHLALLAHVLVEGESIGKIGQLSPTRAKELELRGDVLVAELKVSALEVINGEGYKFASPARFPSVTRDLAVVVDRAVDHGGIVNVLRDAREPLLTSTELFDVFTDDQGEKIAADKKSLAYSLTYRAEDRTLKAEEVNAAHARLKTALLTNVARVQFRE